jgi:response regulator RpfG family c-di-GMP phosphodiesterase
MAEKISVVPLKKIIDSNSHYMEILLREVSPVICINRTAGKNRVINFKALYENNNRFWLQTGAWEYFLKSEDFAKLRRRAPAGTVSSDRRSEAAPKEEEPLEEVERLVDPGFGREYAAISGMTAPERVERIKESKSRLDGLIAAKSKDHELLSEALVDTTRDAALINRATLLEAMQAADEEAKRRTQALVDCTQDMVKSSVRLISENIFNDDLVKTLVEKSNGTVIQHMTRVFLNGVAFLSYYNDLVSTSSLINKIRISFDKKYKNYYRGLLPHVHADDITMEKVFYKGMRAVREEEFCNWATGFLIHDIGKASAVEYHEGEAAYNRDIVVEHVKVGYTAVMNKTNYPREAGLITGYHHEYYGDPAGYGYFRSYLDQYKKLRPEAALEACISYELEPMMDYEALAYFPAKILEIIDVYDSVADPNRKYRKALSPEEALAMLRDEFIEKHVKIDVILYDIFAGFVRQRLAKN